MALEAGTRIGRYTITRLLAQGGMAEVYRAEQDLAGGITRPVAVKVIRPEYSESADFREMFLDEARTACTLSHPNIVHLYEVGESDEGQLYMAMELVTGETLATINRTLREHDERFSDEALVAIGVATASALEAVHALMVEGGTVNLVHRDVSPHNLMLSANGALKLIDFGIAKAATNRNLTLPGVTKGKAGYFSPEQAMGKRLDGRSDLFSLGVTLYKLACGATPFDAHPNHAERHAALVRGQFQQLDEVFLGLPAGFYAVLRRLLTVDPAARCSSAREARELLERAAFDGRLRVGQSTLTGYVDEEGQVTVGGSGRVTARPPLPSPVVGPQPEPDAEVVPPAAVPPTEPHAGPSRVTDLTRRATGSPQSGHREHPDSVLATLKSPLVLLAFFASVVIGVFGVMLLLGPPPAGRRVEGALNTVKPKGPPKPAPVTAAPPVVRAVEAPAPTEGRPPVVAKREPRVVMRPATEKRAEPPSPQPIAPGEGKLRINVNAPGRSSVMVDQVDWGEPPVNRRLSSGDHRIVVRLADGTTPSMHVPVHADQTTIVTYDAPTQRWTTRSQ
jgi:tRNA A-37 threonylcarbamoyl transferase component Bud32